jgi:hypothetical protein
MLVCDNNKRGYLGYGNIQNYIPDRIWNGIRIKYTGGHYQCLIGFWHSDWHVVILG